MKTAIEFGTQALLYVSLSSERKNIFIKFCVPPVVVYSTNVWFISLSNSGSYFLRNYAYE
jgi:hypothetical protein